MHDKLTGSQDIQNTEQHLSMLFEGSSGNLEEVIWVLCDTGATANFVSPWLLAKLGIAWQPTDAGLRLEDNIEGQLIGKEKVELKIQHFSTVLHHYVTDLCDEFNMDSCNSFLAAHKAEVNYERHCILLTRVGRKYSCESCAANESHIC